MGVIILYTFVCLLVYIIMHSTTSEIDSSTAISLLFSLFLASLTASTARSVLKAGKGSVSLSSTLLAEMYFSTFPASSVECLGVADFVY